MRVKSLTSEREMMASVSAASVKSSVGGVRSVWSIKSRREGLSVNGGTSEEKSSLNV